jgi:tetraacyldisaccharide 4'-kinase
MNPVRYKLLRNLLAPCTPFYGLIVTLRNKLYDYNILKSTEFQLPIISIGNITVGGTGKTPHVEYLISLLDGEFSLAALSRGYKRKTRNFVLATTESTTEEIGDEPKQIKRKFSGIKVAVDSNRVRGIRKLMSDFKDLHLIILDDAFQHRSITPGLSILLIDYNRPLSDDHLLPLGDLRENPNEKRRAHIIIVTKCPPKLKPIERRLVVKDLNPFPYQTLYFTTMIYGEFYPVFEDAAPRLSKNQCKEEKYRLHMVTGIVNSRPLKKHLRGISPKITESKFPDHHHYSEKDLNEIASAFEQIDHQKKIIITTEKDAVRFQSIKGIKDTLKKNLYYIPVGIEFLDDEEESFNNQIISYVRKNKRDSILYKKEN